MNSRNTFSEIADLYDKVRPGYSDAVIDEILAYAALPRGGRILEIGCGTGQITVPLAGRGYSVTALEPADGMAKLASIKCAPFPNVTIVKESFEEWRPQRQSFRLVLSAQAFHWIEPEYGCSKAADALELGGTFALVWHHDRSEETDFYKMSQSVYDRYLPSEEQTGPARSSLYEDVLRRSTNFADIHETRHAWEKVYDSCEYLGLLNTFSDHRTLPEPTRARFLREISDILESVGGMVLRKYETQVLLAHRV